MNQFRYDVTLYTGDLSGYTYPSEEIDWQDYFYSPQQLIRFFQESRRNAIYVKNITNVRLNESVNVTTTNNADLILKGIHPASIYQLCEREGLYCVATWSKSNKPELFDLIIADKPCISHPKQIYENLPVPTELANEPLKVRLTCDYVARLSAYLKQYLPSYMQPAVIRIISEIPLTTQGKLDYKALPEPIVIKTSSHYQAPSTHAEKVLVDLWKNLLPVYQVGVSDNFFDLGGHSLLAVQLVHKIKEQFNIDICVSDLQQNPTLQALAAYIDRATEESAKATKELSQLD